MWEDNPSISKLDAKRRIWRFWNVISPWHRSPALTLIYAICIQCNKKDDKWSGRRANVLVQVGNDKLISRNGAHHVLPLQSNRQLESSLAPWKQVSAAYQEQLSSGCRNQYIWTISMSCLALVHVWLLYPGQRWEAISVNIGQRIAVHLPCSVMSDKNI